MNSQVEEKIEEQERAADLEANENEAVRREEDETLDFAENLIGRKAMLQYREALDFKYIDAFINFDEAKVLVDDLRKELSDIPEEAQKSVRAWLEGGAKPHKKPVGPDAQRAVTLIQRIPNQQNEVVRLNRLARYYEKLLHRVEEEFLPKCVVTEDSGADVAAIPTAGKSLAGA